MIAMAEKAVAPAASAVDTAGFKRPAVVEVEVILVIPVRAWKVAAIPPPATIASDHFMKGLNPATDEAIAITPALTAAGPATRSSRWSTHGM
jgi:hypothetical protein